jgi:hypothetical protein
VEDIEAQKALGFVLSTDGLLYKGDKLSDTKLVVPETLTGPVIQMHRDKVFAGHHGIKRTRDLLKLHYYWPNMNRDVEKYVKQCELFSKHKVRTVRTDTSKHLWTLPGKEARKSIPAYDYRSFYSIPGGNSNSAARCIAGGSSLGYGDLL